MAPNEAIPLGQSRRHSDSEPPHGLLDLEAMHTEPPRLPQSSSLLARFIQYPPRQSIKLRPTSWLDGMRGVAALGVFLFHSMGCWARLIPAWHADIFQTNVLQLPILRTFFVSGGPAVSLFFVISGYVLTHRSFQSIRAGSSQFVYPAVASSMFRRGFRLYAPVLFITFLEMLGTRLGIAPPLNFHFTPEANIFAQILDWLHETNHLVNPVYNFRRAIHGFVTHPKYEAVVWTIPLEFYGSFICYFWLLALAGLRRDRPRLLLTSAFATFWMISGAWHFFCFSLGMLVADINLGQDTPESSKHHQRPTRTALLYAIFFLSFYAAGFPTLDTEQYPEVHTAPMYGFNIMYYLTPFSLNMEDHARFWWSLSGIGLLFSVSQVTRLKALFESRFCQYAGKISFMLYLIHEYFVVIVGIPAQAMLLHLFGLPAPTLMGPRETSAGYWVVCFLWYPLITIPIFAIAAQLERLIDVPSVNLARWLETKCKTFLH